MTNSGRFVDLIFHASAVTRYNVDPVNILDIMRHLMLANSRCRNAIKSELVTLGGKRVCVIVVKQEDVAGIRFAG